MGSTDPQKSQASIPPGMMPYIGQAQGAIDKVAGSTPNYSNFLNSPSGQMAQQLGQQTLAPGGYGQNAMNFQNNIMSGQFLNPNSNPFLQGVMDQSQTQFNRTLGSGMDQLSSYMNLHGQSPTGSGAFGNAAAQFATNAAQNQGQQVNQQLFGNYQQGLQQMLQTLFAGNPGSNAVMGGMGLADLPNTMAVQQMQANMIPAQLYNQFLGSIPLAQTHYGPSEFQQNFGMAMQGLQGAGSLAMAFA